MLPLSICNHMKLFSFILKIYIRSLFLRQFLKNVIKCFKWSCCLISNNSYRCHPVRLRRQDSNGRCLRTNAIFLTQDMSSSPKKCVVGRRPGKKAFMIRKVHAPNSKRVGWRPTFHGEKGGDWLGRDGIAARVSCSASKSLPWLWALN